jgi:hypothetical protein
VFVVVVTVVAIVAVVDIKEAIGSVRYLKDAMDGIVTSLLLLRIRSMSRHQGRLLLVLITAKEKRALSCPVILATLSRRWRVRINRRGTSRRPTVVCLTLAQFAPHFERRK